MSGGGQSEAAEHPILGISAHQPIRDAQQVQQRRNGTDVVGDGFPLVAGHAHLPALHHEMHRNAAILRAWISLRRARRDDHVVGGNVPELLVQRLPDVTLGIAKARHGPLRRA